MKDFKHTCRHFKGEKPCVFSKDDARKCGECVDYSMRGERVLIIKAGSAGDVLRTTSILRALRTEYPMAFITWVVDEKNAEVLAGNPFIDEIVFSGGPAAAFVQAVKFFLAINLDVTRESSAILSLTSARLKKGFTLNRDGIVWPVNLEAIPWYRMSLSDEIKKKNKETYHDIIHDICGVKRTRNRPVLLHKQDDRAWAESFSRKYGLSGTAKKVIGINIGGGTRWVRKTPGPDKWKEIISVLISSLPDSKFVLLAGPKERDQYEDISSFFGEKVIPGGSYNPFGRFAALVGLCDLLVTPDTLALHVATALTKKTVVLFGPTSKAEIELYGYGRAVTAGLTCECCYKEGCETKPDCMGSIDPSAVAKAARELMNG